MFDWVMMASSILTSTVCSYVYFQMEWNSCHIVDKYKASLHCISSCVPSGYQIEWNSCHIGDKKKAFPHRPTRFTEFFEKIAEIFKKTMRNKGIFFYLHNLLHFLSLILGCRFFFVFLQLCLPTVCLQVTRLMEMHITLLTSKGLLLTVCPYVFLQTTRFSEFLVTNTDNFKISPHGVSLCVSPIYYVEENSVSSCVSSGC